MIDAEGMEAVFNSLGKITADIQQVTAALRDVLGGEKGAGSMERIVENLVKLSDAVDKTVRESAGQLDAILTNVAGRVRATCAGSPRARAARCATSSQNIERITKDVRDVLVTVKKVLGANEGDLKDVGGQPEETLEQLDHTWRTSRRSPQNVKEGKGAVGRAGLRRAPRPEAVGHGGGRLRLRRPAHLRSRPRWASRATTWFRRARRRTPSAFG